MLGFKSGLAELVQLGTTSASQAEGRGFKSRTPHLILIENIKSDKLLITYFDKNTYCTGLVDLGMFYFVVSNKIALARSPFASIRALFAASWETFAC